VFGWIASFADEYGSLGRNTLVSTIILENIFLWMRSDFFGSGFI
jgi:hypothetical protein